MCNIMCNISIKTQFFNTNLPLYKHCEAQSHRDFLDFVEGEAKSEIFGKFFWRRSEPRHYVSPYPYPHFIPISRHFCHLATLLQCCLNNAATQCFFSCFFLWLCYNSGNNKLTATPFGLLCVHF